MKPQLKTLTWSDFGQHELGYSPQEKYGDFSGTILDILKDERISDVDKIWAFTTKGVMDDKTLRLFAVRCARRVQHLMDDERSIQALDVAERYANGLATNEELTKARWVAWAAVGDARRAAGDAVRAAVWAARVGARVAAQGAAWAARWATEAVDEAWGVARETQVQIAIELVEEFYQH